MNLFLQMIKDKFRIILCEITVNNHLYEFTWDTTSSDIQDEITSSVAIMADSIQFTGNQQELETTQHSDQRSTGNSISGLGMRHVDSQSSDSFSPLGLTSSVTTEAEGESTTDRPGVESTELQLGSDQTLISTTRTISSRDMSGLSDIAYSV